MMAEPNPKRPKMDSPNTQKSSISPKDRKIQRRLIDTSTHRFDEIRFMPGFVDHTHFIRIFLLMNNRLAIFAPRRFGKSTHLSMVLNFLNIDVDETTGEVSSSVDGPANRRKNYKLFEGTRIITDDNNNDLVEDHLGKHPVIHLVFKGANIKSVEDAEMHYRRAVHQTYKKHPYLKTSTKLVPGDEEGNRIAQSICEEWCHDMWYQMQTVQDLKDSLDNLVKYLYNHFNKAKVYILVDEFDAIDASAMREIPEEIRNRVDKIKTICNILRSLLEPVTEGCDLVGGVIFTGISGSYQYHMRNITTLQFLGRNRIAPKDPDFVPFYGATREELDSLIQKLVKNKELTMFEDKAEFLNDTNELDVKKIMDAVQSHYNCYFDVNGIRIFSLWSILQYLESGIVKNYWNETDGTQDLYMILKSPGVARKIINLLMRSEMIEFGRRHLISTESFVKLHDLLTGKIESIIGTREVFDFLMDQGYLSYAECRSQYGKLQLPNPEIRAAFSDMIGDIVTKHWNIATTSCSNLIDDICLSLKNDKEAFQDNMLDIHKAISLIMKPLEQTNSTILIEIKMFCIMDKVLNDAKSFEFYFYLPIKDADRPHFLLHHKNDKKFSILWEIKYASSRNSRASSIYALQLARGIVAPQNGKTIATKYGKKKNYMDSLKQLGRENVLVIGLSIDTDIKVSLSYALGIEDKIFSISKTEADYYPGFYRTYNVVSLPLEENDD